MQGKFCFSFSLDKTSSFERFSYCPSLSDENFRSEKKLEALMNQSELKLTLVTRFYKFMEDASYLLLFNDGSYHRRYCDNSSIIWLTLFLICGFCACNLDIV